MTADRLSRDEIERLCAELALAHQHLAEQAQDSAVLREIEKMANGSPFPEFPQYFLAEARRRIAGRETEENGA